MLYKRYQLYDNKIEIMLPSDFERVEGQEQFGQYAWCSQAKTVRVDISTKMLEDREQSMSQRLQERYVYYKREMVGFSCKHVIKKQVWGREFGEMAFSSKQMGYGFYHVLLVGQFADRELSLALQCMESEKNKMEHVFSIILDSIRVSSDLDAKEGAHHAN